MRTAFVLLYALAGTLLLFVDLSWTGAASVDARLYVGLTALLFLFAAWQGWFHGGLAWRAVHVTFGVINVALCLSLLRRNRRAQESAALRCARVPPGSALH